MENRASDNDQSERARPALSLVTKSSGAAEDKADMEMYAAMLPRAHILGSITRRHLMIAGGFGLLLLGLALARHLPASDAAAASLESDPGVAPSAPAPAPSVPAIPAPTPVAVPLPAAVPVAVAQEPQAAPLPAAAPAAVAQEPQAVAAPAPKAEQAPSPATGSEAQNVEGCRQALKRRDVKLVSTQCEGALAADPSLVKPLLALAKAQFENGKAARAAVWARMIVQVNSSLPDAYLIIGVAEQEALNPAAAKTAYQRYLQLAPSGTFADDVRSSLKSL
jgi:hypothetical protein